MQFTPTMNDDAEIHNTPRMIMQWLTQRHETMHQD
jgi:hypothetical protein